MPISAFDGYTSEHWVDVKSIITDSVESLVGSNFTVRLVSDADATGVIQKRIVQNLYSSDIVVCDVSGKNPNVMFELGMRLAFDKATVIVKDDATDYAFDTGIIEHLTYPRDLRFPKIVDFKSLLARKVEQTHQEAIANPDHSIFLKNFGQFKVAALSETEVLPSQLILDRLDELQAAVMILRRRVEMTTVTSIPSETSIRELSRLEFQRRVRRAMDAYLTSNTIAPAQLIGDAEFCKLVARHARLDDSLASSRAFADMVDTLLRSRAANPTPEPPP
jgi:hypothetical protein